MFRKVLPFVLCFALGGGPVALAQVTPENLDMSAYIEGLKANFTDPIENALVDRCNDPRLGVAMAIYLSKFINSNAETSNSRYEMTTARLDALEAKVFKNRK